MCVCMRVGCVCVCTCVCVCLHTRFSHPFFPLSTPHCCIAWTSGFEVMTFLSGHTRDRQNMVSLLQSLFQIFVELYETQSLSVCQWMEHIIDFVRLCWHFNNWCYIFAVSVAAFICLHIFTHNYFRRVCFCCFYVFVFVFLQLRLTFNMRKTSI